MSGRDKELRSAFDIAMEKARKLGDMSAQEKQRSKDEELRAIGEVLGKRYLDGLPVRDVEIELRKHEENRQTVVRYLLSFLLDALIPANSERAENILVAIQHFSGNSDAVARVRELYNEYQKAWKEKRDKIIEARRKELELKGISGSAVEPAIEADSKQLDTTYRKHFEETITTLLKAL
jgi:hypothetical protein